MAAMVEDASSNFVFPLFGAPLSYFVAWFICLLRICASVNSVPGSALFTCGVLLPSAHWQLFLIVPLLLPLPLLLTTRPCGTGIMESVLFCSASDADNYGWAAYFPARKMSPNVALGGGGAPRPTLRPRAEV